MTPLIKSLSDYTGTNGLSVVPGSSVGGGGVAMPSSGGGGGGGGAQEGLGQIYSGAGTVGSAISTAAQALGGGGGDIAQSYTGYKKGGSVKKNYTSKGGKINLGSGRVSTASKNKANPNW